MENVSNEIRDVLLLYSVFFVGKLNGETISAASNESVEYMLLDDEP